MDADYTTNEEGYEVIFKPERPNFELPPRPETFRGQPLSQGKKMKGAETLWYLKVIT